MPSPLPRIEESLDALSGARWFSTVDLASGYNQVPVTEKDKIKTASCTPFNLFEWNTMPFGLWNSAGLQNLLTLTMSSSTGPARVMQMLFLGSTYPARVQLIIWILALQFLRACSKSSTQRSRKQISDFLVSWTRKKSPDAAEQRQMSKEALALVMQWDRIVEQDGVLYRKVFSPDSDEVLQLVLS